MWCRSCDIETTESTCPICGQLTEDYIPTEIWWCPNCKTPHILHSKHDESEEKCKICFTPLTYRCKDMRPVFPEEIILLEILLKKPAGSLSDKGIWSSSGKYYIDGKNVSISSWSFSIEDIGSIVEQLNDRRHDVNYALFEDMAARFVLANAERLEELTDEAFRFIQDAAKDYDEEKIVVSFSGGKDSTVTADLVVRALSNPSLVHIFGNTTLEFPTTKDYVTRFRETHPYAIFKEALNREQSFMEVAADIGPPARMMRWCCSMFKTGPITRVLNSLYGNERILTFYGIRRTESVSRSKYNRIEDDATSIKINKQTVASPIFFWNDIDIWLYILSEKIDFNDAYRFGYERVGCWLCPNNTPRDVFLSRLYMPEKYDEWRKFLVGFAKKIGKPDPEEYIDSGAWKARQGGNGLAASEDIKITYTNCTAEEHAKIYKLNKPFDREFTAMFVPFGRVAPELGQKLLHEVIVLDTRTNVPILSLQPFESDEYPFAVKIKTLNVSKSDHKKLQEQAAYQVRKFNACRKCLKCESVCREGAISITAAGYYIDPSRCIHCKMCVTPKFLRGGCLMEKYLRTKE